MKGPPPRLPRREHRAPKRHLAELTYEAVLATHAGGTHFLIGGREVCIPDADVHEHNPETRRLVVWGTEVPR